MRKSLGLLLICAPIAAFAAAPQTAVLDLQKMTCPICRITVEKALEKTPGVIDAKVDYDHKTATVTYDPEKTTPTALTKATENAGFPSAIHGAPKR